MGLWSGLGYYSRARNLHRCAQQVMAEHGGAFPNTAEALATLPGIGRSTAGAIAAFCFSERVPILDANARRVLTRLSGFARDLASAGNERLLSELAQSLLPTRDLAQTMPRYNQGLMDLGSALCTAQAPRCSLCPLTDSCVAFRDAAPERYPVRPRKLSRQPESWQLLLVRDGQEQVWLQRRPPTGIWAGLHCVPVFADAASLAAFVAALGAGRDLVQERLPPFVHVLTHRDLHLHPVVVRGNFVTRPSDDGQWLGPDRWPALGLPAPIRKLLAATQTRRGLAAKPKPPTETATCAHWRPSSSLCRFNAVQRLPKDWASLSTRYTERCWPPVQPRATVTWRRWLRSSSSSQCARNCSIWARIRSTSGWSCRKSATGSSRPVSSRSAGS